jgi:hypothetical protein
MQRNKNDMYDNSTTRIRLCLLSATAAVAFKWENNQGKTTFASIACADVATSGRRRDPAKALSTSSKSKMSKSLIKNWNPKMIVCTAVQMSIYEQLNMESSQ